MATAFEFNWPALDTAAVCALQTTAGAGNLILNGDMVTSDQFGNKSALFPKIYRSVSITSTGNLSGLTFTITGNHVSVSTVSPAIEAIPGPNNDTVYTSGLFDSVTSVHVSGAVGTAVSVGIGTTGQTLPYIVNQHSTVANLGVQTVVLDDGGAINYSLFTSMYSADDILANTGPSLLFNPVVALTGATTSQFASVTIPVKYAVITINSSSGGATLEGVYLQQGIT